MKIVFAGTPEITLPTLNAIKAINDIELSAIITQPDAPKGRGLQLTPPAVKLWAQKHSIPLFQPDSINQPDFMETFSSLKPDVLLVFAYAQLLKEPILQLPKWGCYNIHTSLLPRWRGASPIQNAVLSGDAETGVTLQKMVKALDAGAVVHQKKILLPKDMGTIKLSEALSELSAQLIQECFPWQGIPSMMEQDPSLVTYAGLIKKQDGFVLAQESPEKIYRKMLAYEMWPGVRTQYKGLDVKIMEPVRWIHDSTAKPGKLNVGDSFLWETTGGKIEFKKLQFPGEKALTAKDILNGKKVKETDVLGI